MCVRVDPTEAAGLQASTTCLTDDQLRLLAAGEEADRNHGLSRDHLASCQTCARRLRNLRDFLNLPPDPDLKHAVSPRNQASPLQPDSCTSSPPISAAVETRSNALNRDIAVPDIPGYSIVREIHRGGQGVVYEAVQRGANRTVAVKVMLHGVFASERSRNRFEREVKLIARLKHANIVVLYDSGIDQGRGFFAMEYICGEPLDQYVRYSKIPIRDIVCLFVRVCDAVHYAHQKEIVHRDLKPSNILVDGNGDPKVLDFGLAKMIGDEMEESCGSLKTQDGRLMGTLPYMSPEQTCGKPDLIDVRSDIYTLGVILYELLTQAVPYETVTTDQRTALGNICEIDPCRPSRIRRDIKPELDAIVLKAMQKDKERRYESVAQLRQDLQDWLDGRPVKAKSDSALYVLRKLVVRHGFEAGLLSAVVVAMIAFATIAMQGLLYGQRMKSQRDMSDAAVQGISETRVLAEVGANAATRRMALGWFLMEWHAGRVDRARELQEQLPEGSPERVALSFLLDDTYGIEQMMADLDGKATALMHYVIGERHVRSGRNESAVAAFTQCVRTARAVGDAWWESTGRARLDQLRAGRAGSQPASGAESAKRGNG